MNLPFSQYRVRFPGQKPGLILTVLVLISTDYWLDISGVVYSDSDSGDSPVVKHRKHFKNSTQHQVASTSKMSDPREEKLLDQALINQKILSQLDAIGKG